MKIEIQSEAHWKDGLEGLFSLSEATYRGALGVSQSMLKTVMRSPACVEQEIRFPREATWSMELGTLAHAAILEPATFGDGVSHYVKPATYESGKEGVKPWNANANVCKEWLAEHSDKPVLSLDEHRSIIAMRTNFMGDEFGAMFAKKGNGEVAIFQRDKATGVMLKGRLDLFAFSDEEVLIGDLKITADDDDFEFSQKCARMKYHVQSDFYRSLVSARLEAMGLAERRIRFLHCTIGSSAPHYVEWRELDEDALRAGGKLWRDALSEYVKAQETGWFSKIRTVSLPRWAME
jgi:hypothetical protein